MQHCTATCKEIEGSGVYYKGLQRSCVPYILELLEDVYNTEDI